MSPFDTPPQFLTERTIRVAQPLARDAGTSNAKQRQVIALQVQQPAADWLRSAVQRIENLTTLARDWNSYGSHPVTAEAALAAVRFLLDTAYRELGAPAIVPLPDGGVQVEWHRGGLDVEIAFSEDEPGIYVEDHETGQSFVRSLGEAATLLVQLSPRLSS
jgi:hypothetical protein